MLAWQAWQSLNALSDQAALVNRTTLIDARRSEAMTNAALEMERSYRQYCVLDDPTLAKVLSKPAQAFTAKCSMPHAGVLPDDKLYQALRQDLNNLAPNFSVTTVVPMLPPPRVLKPLPVPIPKWCRPRAQWCSRRGQQLQREIAERGQYFGWQSLVLFLVSLVMVLLFTRDDYRAGEKYRAHDQPSGGRAFSGQ